MTDLRPVCEDHDPRVFYPHRGDRAANRYAVALCHTCPLLEPCLPVPSSGVSPQACGAAPRRTTGHGCEVAGDRPLERRPPRWNARQEAARDAYDVDPFGGAREGAVSQLYAWRAAGRISAFDYLDGCREVRAWGRT